MIPREFSGAFDEIIDAPVEPSNIHPLLNGAGHKTNGVERHAKKVSAAPYVWRDPATIPRRAWLYGRHYIRRFVSGTVAPGGLAKSSLLLVEAVAIALGKPLLGITPAEAVKVWYWNGEDPQEETERRIAAISQHYDLNGQDLQKALFINSGRLDPIKLAEVAKSGITFDSDLVGSIIETIQENDIGLAIFDPFISTHNVPESDNTHIDALAKKFGHIADETNSSIELAHHVRKSNSGQNETTVDDARGASALMNALRSGRVLNRLPSEQAKKLKIEESRSYFRADTGKANLAPPEAAKWHRIVNVDLVNGDKVGVVESWKYPSPLDRITTEHMQRVRKMAADREYRKDRRSENWIGHALAEVADLDPEDEADLATINAALKEWFANGVLATEERRDENRKIRSFVVPGKWE